MFLFDKINRNLLQDDNSTIGKILPCACRCMPNKILEGFWEAVGFLWKNGRLRAVIFSADRTPSKILRHTSYFQEPNNFFVSVGDEYQRVTGSFTRVFTFK